MLIINANAPPVHDENPWYAVYTRHQHEKAIARTLSSKGHEVFLPLYETAHRWQDRTKQLSLPLFPCYIFIRNVLERRIDILSTPGVFSILGCTGRPEMIPQIEIDAVRQVVENSKNVEPHPFLKCGDRVRVKAGPMQGLEGILVRKKNLFRLVISVEMLGRSASVEIDTGFLERLSFQPASIREISGRALAV